MLTLITAGLIIFVILKLFSLMGKGAPYVLIYGSIYALHFYVWDIICWILAILITIGIVKTMWDKNKKGEWI